MRLSKKMKIEADGTESNGNTMVKVKIARRDQGLKIEKWEYRQPLD